MCASPPPKYRGSEMLVKFSQRKGRPASSTTGFMQICSVKAKYGAPKGRRPKTVAHDE
ncbi:uncharacterized protein FOMMEDRAFT_133188 [Fomitiporia mediterranea MF3/22]|uniref:uncharacterized protein n=1 Tax=Fomitiporia mediterranea (strain MF3/22) TaxID=694068 RepID=UPI00044076FE|nr:uncharacterized protein FOMMEDRAFT_133188 [Fomitiporia mediterranea MF3/22]EJD03812.1 hypothetical protein FOMMEDRAFT_133188 [Fomitiporia mediterranea MF3/22]